MRWVVLFWLSLLAVIASPAAAQTFPPLNGQRVVDQAQLLGAAQVVDLNSKLGAVEQRTGRQLVVVTLKSLEGKTIEDYGYRLGRHRTNARCGSRPAMARGCSSPTRCRA